MKLTLCWFPSKRKDYALCLKNPNPMVLPVVSVNKRKKKSVLALLVLCYMSSIYPVTL